tara:strand:+ start:2762 stop:3910 length:1149 start_codon:yes stop_codon:yes gene_type:complete
MKKINKCKRCKRNKQIKGGGKSNQVTYTHNNREIILIGVNHVEKGITHENMREIIDIGNKKRNVCYLIEFDKRLPKKDIRGTVRVTGELTTKIILPYLKKEFKRVWDNTCIRGWDIRQTLLDHEKKNELDKCKIGQMYQDILYSDKIYNETIGSIATNYIQKIPKKHKIELSKYSNHIGETLQNNFDNQETYHNFREEDDNSLFDWLYLEIPKFNQFQKNSCSRTKPWDQYQLGELRNNFGNKKKYIVHFVKMLRKAFANYSDLILLESILQEDNIMNYIIFQGLEHYNNTEKLMKDLKIQSLTEDSINSSSDSNHKNRKRSLDEKYEPLKKKRKTKSDKRTRKHRGIIQTGGNKGRLRKGYRYSGKRLKSGLPQIIKCKKR